MKRGFALAFVILLAPATPAQVRPLVLESPSRQMDSGTPALYPPRLAKLEPLWEVTAGGTLLPGMVGGPGGVVYGLQDGKVLRRSADDGGVLWQREFDSLQWAPRGTQGRLHVVAQGALVALDPSDGSDLWRQTLDGEAAFPPLLTGALAVVVLADGQVRAMNPEDGALLWSADLGCVPQAEPALGGELLVAGCPDGYVRTLSAADGRLVWERLLPAPVTVQPAIAGKRVFVGTGNFTINCLSARRGKKRYRVHLAGHPASPLLAQGELILAGSQDNLLYGIRQQRGHLAWSADAGSRLLTLPTVRGHVAVASPTQSDQVVVMDLRDGAVTARQFMPGEDRMSAGSPVFAGKTLVVASQPITGGAGWLSGMKLEVITTGKGTAAGR